MGQTPTGRVYYWGTQTNYQTPKTIAASAFRKLILGDKNFLDQEVKTNDDMEWSHGYNTGTEQWLEAHDGKVSHSMPGYIEEIVRPIKLAMGGYAVVTPSGGTVSKKHTITPQDANTSRQLQAVTYGEKIGVHDILVPSMLVPDWTLKGDNLGVLMLDFSLQSAGKLINPSGVTIATHVVTPTNLHKLLNTQIGLVVTDGVTPVTYGCKYRSFELSYKNTMLLEAGFKPGCDQYQTAADRTSGVIRSDLLFDRQEIDFSFELDMEADSGEYDALIKQKPMDITLSATEGIIEGFIPRSMTALMPKVYYKARKLGEGNGLMRFQIAAKVFTNVATGKSLQMEFVNEVATYATW